MGVEFFNRDISWLAFNRRVLDEALDDRNPLLERAKFLSIVSSNLDEFSMVRIPALFGMTSELDEDYSGMTKAQILDQVRSDITDLVSEQYTCWRDTIVPAIADIGLRIIRPQDWNEEDCASLRIYFRDQVEPVLTPLAVDPARPFPLLSNGVIHLAVLLGNDDSDEQHKALVSLPKTSRLVALPSTTDGFALIEDVVAYFMDDLFGGHRIIDSVCFRLTRDGSLDIDEDQATDLMSEIEEELRHRAFGKPVRLEIRTGSSDSLRDWLTRALAISEVDVYSLDGPLDLTFLMGLGSFVNADGHTFPSFKPYHPSGWNDMFAVVQKRDRLALHPYDSFQPIVDLVNQAADDPKVLAIKQTLYRVSGDSPIVRALARAARAGKQVTVLLELKARFDEERNIQWARRLEEAGAHVLYGLVGYKVHSKLLLIVRREQDGLRRYCHIGTGNYNDRTARLYTDYSYLTCNEAVGRDVSRLFNQLTGFSSHSTWERIVPSPAQARDSFYQLIRHEANNAMDGRPARIRAWFNSLYDRGIVEELYAASQAGVQIDLIVRGICILKPGIQGLSENIRVRSIVGRFLEHGRVYWFANNGTPVVLMGSADWMTRNLDRRVESLVRIDDSELQAEMITLLDRFDADNRSSRMLHADGSYTRLYPGEGEEERSVQVQYLQEVVEQQRRDKQNLRKPKAFKPLRNPQG